MKKHEASGLTTSDVIYADMDELLRTGRFMQITKEEADRRSSERHPADAKWKVSVIDASDVIDGTVGFRDGEWCFTPLVK